MTVFTVRIDKVQKSSHPDGVIRIGGRSHWRVVTLVELTEAPPESMAISTPDGYTYLFWRDEDLQKALAGLVDTSDCLQVSKVQEIHEVYDTPQEWSITYEPTQVVCDDCGHTFLHTELEYYEEGDYWNDAVCPACHAVACVELVYESLHQYRERTAGKDDRVHQE